jgi:hypothetical protein
VAAGLSMNITIHAGSALPSLRSLIIWFWYWFMESVGTF